jgi:CHAD domain-containing protein
VRLDAGPEGVHQMRVGARRLRSDLRTFDDLLADGWVDPMRDELRWLATALGKVRDADVLRIRFEQQTGSLPPEDADSIPALVRRLARERDEALEAAVALLGSERYGALLDQLVDAAQAPALTPAAAKPAVDVLTTHVRGAWRKLSKAAGRLGDDPSADELHRVRILAKKARYAADVAVPVLGKPARVLSSTLADLQDVLGAGNDAAVAEAWLRSAASSGTRTQALVAGHLVAVQRREIEEAAGQWRSVWKAAAKQGRKWPA